jgi:hypothetical protein
MEVQHPPCYGRFMTKEDLEGLFERIRVLPPEKLEELQDMVAVLEAGGVFDVPAEAWPGIERGMADADAGRFASTGDVADLFAKARRF